MPWAQPAAPAASRPAGPSVWNVPAAPTPNAPPATPPIAMPPGPPAHVANTANGATPPVPPFPPATPPAAPIPNAEVLDIASADLSAVTNVGVTDPATTKSNEAKAPEKDPKPVPRTTTGGRSRAPLAVLGLVVVVGVGAVGGMYAGVIPDVIGIKPAATETPIAEVTPTAAPSATETAVAMTSATAAPSETPAPTATATAAPTATPVPTATAVAVLATPKPTPSPAATKAPEDPEVKKKRAVGLVKIGNDALNAGDGTKAVRNFGAAIANDPNNADAYLGLGTAYMLQGQNAKAKSSFKKFLQLAPDHQYAAQTRQILGTL